MNFLEIQNEVLSDRFAESKRASAKRWINARYGRLWGMEPWSFKKLDTTVTLPLGASTVSIAASVQRIFNVWDVTTGTQGTPMRLIRPEDFYDESVSSSGIPNGVTVINGVLKADRLASSNRTLRIIGETKFTELSADADIPAIPSEFHYTLVHGAAAEGLRLENDPSWQGFEDDWTRGIEDMKRNYMTEALSWQDHYPDWP